LPLQATTRITDEQVAQIAERVQMILGGWEKTRGAPRSLTITEAVRATIMYMRHNITEECIGDLYGVSQPTISRCITLLTPLVGDVTEEHVPDPGESIKGQSCLVDGSVLPCWSWKGHWELWSGKTGITGHNAQFVTDLRGNLQYISDPLPGSVHDAEAFRQAGLPGILLPGNSAADLGYLGLGLITPYRKPPGGELTSEQKEFNKAVSKIRAPVERAIANFKVWRVMHTDYRRPLGTYRDTFNAVRGLHFFQMTN
jgi:hypothetical protein